jgi:hypothetical protein
MKTIDTQAMNLIRSLNAPKPVKSPHQRNMAAIKAVTDNICIEGAISILAAFKYEKDTFHYLADKWIVKDFGNEAYFPDHAGRMAAETPVIYFWGGPPTKLKWYQGTLQTLLDDRIMCEVATQGSTKVAKLIGLDLEVDNLFASTVPF